MNLSGGRFSGVSRLDLRQGSRGYPDAIVLIAFASERPEILARFFAISRQHETYAPHLPLFGDESVVSPVGSLPMKRNWKLSMNALPTARAAVFFAISLTINSAGN